MTTYSALLIFDGTVSDISALRDDGILVALDPKSTDADAVAFQAWLSGGNVLGAPVRLPAVSVVSQDLMAQFTTDDLTKIKAAVDTNIQFWGLWSAMTTQKDPMVIANARFQAGWAALVQVLGADRMAAIATALNITV